MPTVSCWTDAFAKHLPLTNGDVTSPPDEGLAAAEAHPGIGAASRFATNVSFGAGERNWQGIGGLLQIAADGLPVGRFSGGCPAMGSLGEEGDASLDNSVTGGPPLLIASELFRTSRHPPGHPLAIPRVSLMVDLCRALGWLTEDRYREACPATALDLARYHDPAYVAAVARAEREQVLSDSESRRFNLGINGNPIFGDVFRRPATACGASLWAAQHLVAGGIVYNPTGGTHHAARAHASGYCIFNDAALAIHRFLDDGLERVFYLDLDAHFGDGVQAAFSDDARVFTLSVHEAGRWPMSRDDAQGPGSAGDRAGGMARNLPVPAGFNDSEMAWLQNEVVLPLIEGFRPQAIVVQCGADALADDPMTKLTLSNRALWDAVGSLVGRAPRLLVLGGGGYNPWAVARSWAGIWATLNDLDLPDRLPATAEALMRAVRWSHRLGRSPAERWLTTIADPPAPGPVRDAVKALARRASVG